MSVQSSAEPMKFVYFDQYAPRSYKEDGRMKGILIDIVDGIITKRMGIPVQHDGYPWSRAQAMVKAGYADAFITVPTPERLSYTTANSETVLLFETFLAAANSSPHFEKLKNVKTVEELKDFRLVDYLGNNYAKVTLKNMDVTWLPDYHSIFTFLIQNKADAILASRKTINTMISLGFTDKVTAFDNPLTSIRFHLCIRKDSEYVRILGDFDRILKEMKKNGEIEAIIEKYY